MCITIGYSQKKSSTLSKVNSNQFEIGLSSGISSPSSNFSDNSFADNGSFYELMSSYYFSKLGIGVSLGQFSNPTNSNLESFTSKESYPISTNSEKWKISYYSIGPNYKQAFGNFEAIILARTGLMSVKSISLEGNFSSSNNDPTNPTDITIPVYNLRNTENTQTGFYSAGLKFAYKINPSLKFYLLTNYLSSFSDKINLEERTKQFTDINKDGVINEIDILKQDGIQVEFKTTTKSIKPQSFNYGIGLTWNTSKGSKVRKPTQDIKSVSQNQENREQLDFQKPDKVEKQKSKVQVRGWNPKDKSPRKVVFTNPAKEKKKQKRKLIPLSPKNNASYQQEIQLKRFTWKLVGERIMKPKYGIEVSKIGADKNNQWLLFAKTNQTKLSLNGLFNQNKSNVRVSERLRHKDRAVFTEGNYKWRVTETTTGLSTPYSFFNFTNCEIDFSITNEEIECLGYEGEDRKYKICFDATYSSPNGDLTYANVLSGLSVYDQSYATLAYTLVSPNPTLVTQIGASISTVSYCFEVTVSSGVTSIGYGLQGDDLDPSPIICQPGVSSSFNELPDCLCDECEEIELSFDDFSITPNGGTGNQFNFNGNINVNVPIYGIEFQIQSYSYTANPSACTEGVSSLEESGMILMPATTINGSSTLQLFNESISGSTSSNNNASKAVKYTSNSALTGAIPVNLTIGLPGPISGLDPSCCVIEYEVCIKVRIFYEESNCKSCVFTHCFEFNNQ